MPVHPPVSEQQKVVCETKALHSGAVVVLILLHAWSIGLKVQRRCGVEGWREATAMAALGHGQESKCRKIHLKFLHFFLLTFESKNVVAMQKEPNIKGSRY